MNLKKLMKRLCSGFMAFALVGTFAPTALAAPPTGVDIYSNHYVIMDGQISATPLDGTACDKFTPADQDVIGTTDDTTIDLWVSSTDMSGDTYQIPYVIDDSGNTWYLQQIVLYNFIDDRDASQTLMDADAIATATSKENYTFNVSDITIDPYTIDGYSWYDVCYGWTMTPPEQWGGGSGTQETYTVTYDFNIPKDVNSIFPITDDGIQGNESTGSYDYINNKVATLTSTKLEDQSFVVADGLEIENDSVWHGFFGYRWNDPDTSYYYFDGWKAEDGSEYETGATATASDTLAGTDSKINFTGVWTKVTKWTDEQLAAAEQSIPLDVFTRGDNGDLLIAQSTDTLTKNDNLISYTVSTAVNDDLLLKSNVPFMGEKFATFEILVNVDSNLEFANRNQDGTVTLRMESKLVVPKTIDTKTGSSAWTGDGTNWTVTFDPDQLPSSENSLKIHIQAEFTGEDYTIVSDVMTLTGLDFKLKEDVFESTGVAPQVSTSANMTAKMNLRNMAGTGGPEGWANTRFRLWVVERLLGKNDANGEEWRKYFSGGVDNPTAYVHALQFLDYKLADYDLSADKTATLQANTVTATIFESEPIEIKPADITVYEGGDGGYDAVVDGSTTTTSNSLPHPLFHITTPDGTDPADLTFRNGDKSWTVISDGNGYYHFAEGAGQDKVRVTYSYTDEDGAKHTVTEDAFDPATMGDVYGQLTIELYPGENNLNDVTAKTKDGKTYQIKAGTGTLTVRAVEKETGATSDITEAAPTTKLNPNTATAVDLAGTTYTLNDTDVALPTDGTAKPSLLFDDIIESDGKPRVDALEDAVDTALGTTDGTRHYEAKYLDLVDANNGNAWISSSKGTDIYWGYPTGTDKNTNFTLVHFRDLHRDGTESGFDIDDINSDNVEVLTTKDGKIVNTDYGIKFHVAKGGFSPFVLVWETEAEEPDPGTDPNPGGGGSHSDPTGNLTISLGGNGGNEDFIFTVIFTDEDGDELENNFYYNGDYTGTIGSGDEITLTGGDKIVIRNLPEGTRYEVIIETADGYTATSTGAEGVIRTSGNEAAFSVTPTVVLADPSVTGVTRWLNTTDHTAYLSGYPGGTFGPDNSMTRAEVAQMFYALLLNKDVTITKTFSDVPADAWYATAVNTLASLGMVSGDPDGAFRPNDPITRAEFCVIALAFAYEPDNAVCYFGDVSRSDWFYTYVAQAASYGWIGGYTNGNFGPNDQITRAQVTTIVNNMLGRVADRDYVIDHQADLVQFSDLTRAHWGYFQIMEATNAHDYTKSNGTESWR